MVQLIVGEKGKGKTKELLDKVNKEIKEVNGTIVYLDKSAKHMYELNNKIRLINVCDYPLHNSQEFLGFICGIISQDNDLEKMYLDSFLKIAKVEDDELSAVLHELESIGKTFNISFVVSLSKNENELPEDVKDMILLSL